jgi:hypothetical protein
MGYQVILLTISPSVRLGLEPLVVTHSNILARKKMLVVFRGTAMYRGHTFRLCCVYVHTRVDVDRVRGGGGGGVFFFTADQAGQSAVDLGTEPRFGLPTRCLPSLTFTL